MSNITAMVQEENTGTDDLTLAIKVSWPEDVPFPDLYLATLDDLLEELRLRFLSDQFEMAYECWEKYKVHDIMIDIRIETIVMSKAKLDALPVWEL